MVCAPRPSSAGIVVRIAIKLNTRAEGRRARVVFVRRGSFFWNVLGHIHIRAHRRTCVYRKIVRCFCCRKRSMTVVVVVCLDANAERDAFEGGRNVYRERDFGQERTIVVGV